MKVNKLPVLLLFRCIWITNWNLLTGMCGVKNHAKIACFITKSVEFTRALQANEARRAEAETVRTWENK